MRGRSKSETKASEIGNPTTGGYGTAWPAGDAPLEGKFEFLTENARKMAVLGRFSVLLGWNPGPVVVLCLGGTLCKFPQRYIDHKLQVSLFHTSEIVRDEAVNDS